MQIEELPLNAGVVFERIVVILIEKNARCSKQTGTG